MELEEYETIYNAYFTLFKRATSVRAFNRKLLRLYKQWLRQPNVKFTDYAIMEFFTKAYGKKQHQR